VSLNQRLVRVEGFLDSVPQFDALDDLRALMRYLLTYYHLMTIIPLGHKTREQMTPEEWNKFRRGSVEFFDSHQSEFGTERKMREYVTFHTKFNDAELLQATAELHAMPDAGDYFY
jgi:hypothetical protein